MKSYDEMVNDVFCRISEYEHEKKYGEKGLKKSQLLFAVRA